MKFCLIRVFEIHLCRKSSILDVTCPQTPQPISETAGDFRLKFSRGVRGGTGGRHYCFRIFKFLPIDPGKIDKVIDRLKKVRFLVHFLTSRRQGAPVENFPHQSFYSRPYPTSWYMNGYHPLRRLGERGVSKKRIK